MHAVSNGWVEKSSQETFPSVVAQVTCTISAQTTVGARLGAADSSTVKAVGTIEGMGDGPTLGVWDGVTVGPGVGAAVGCGVGATDGRGVGAVDGRGVGEVDGRGVGAVDG